jgi:serine/threonine-protein kinase
MHYLAWPLVQGETLDKVMARDGKLSARHVAYIAIQLAEGLDVCHHQALFHGLLKPSNIMVGPDQQVYILDFGIGCLLAETEGESLVDTMSTANSVASGLDCASPESIMDPTNLTPTGDQYSLGCVLYYLLAGQYPFPEGSAAEKMMAHQFKQPEELGSLAPETPPQLVAVVKRLMEKKPEERFRGVGEIVEALRPLAPRASAVQARPTSKAVHETRRPAPSKPEAKASPETPKAVSPSSPTPKPQTMGSLPTRDTLRGSTPVNKTLPKPEKPPLPGEKPAASAAVPGADFEEEISFWDARMSPMGVVMTAALACVVGYLAFWFLN